MALRLSSFARRRWRLLWALRIGSSGLETPKECRPHPTPENGPVPDPVLPPVAPHAVVEIERPGMKRPTLGSTTKFWQAIASALFVMNLKT